MIFTEDNLKSCRALSLSAYQTWHDALSAQDFRTESLSLAGPPSAPLYTSVMVKRDTPFAGRSVPKLSGKELEAKVLELRKQTPPLHPYIVTATGPRGKAVYAASFRKAATQPVFVSDLSAEDLAEVNKAQRTAGNILIWVDAFGTPGDIRYCAIWSLNGGLHAWNAEAVDDKGKSLKQRSDALLSVGARPTLVALTPAGGLAALYVDNVLTRPWSMNAPLSAAELKLQMAAEAEEDRFPIRIGTATVGGAVQFAAIFAGTDDIVQRKLRPPSGPVPEGLSAIDQARVKSIDKWMGKYLTSNNLRGAALAIVDGTRLVYAKGYTYAEPGPMYPDIEPTTLFRLGSVSKTFCAVAVWKALAEDPARSRSSKMQKVLALEPEEGDSIPAGFADVTIRHLLESNSGIDQFGMSKTLNRVQRDGGEQPLTAARIARAVAGLPMSGVPGAMTDGKQDTQYGKVDYFLLGLVAAELAGTADFDSALKKLVLDPLHMTRTRGARAKIEDRTDDEARHHMPGIETGPSEMHADVPRPIMPLQYAGSNCEVYDGAGGVSAAVVDVARLGAMFACRAGNPIFPAATLDAMIGDAVAATAAGSDHGYHGFDWVIRPSPTNPTVTYEKGGDIAGAGAVIHGEIGKRVVVIFRNGEYLLWGNRDWWNAILPLADAIAWGEGDLFPDYGMPSL